MSEDGPTEDVNDVQALASACAYSGLEDTGGPGQTQTPKGTGAFTGIACRGSGGGRIHP